MPRFSYVNGRYVPHALAQVHVEDRGYQFADGVYEVCEVRDGSLVEERPHLERLARSLSELRIRPPMSDAALGAVMREVVRRNRVRHGVVYVQVTRGVAPRQHAFPGAATAPGIVVTARHTDHRRRGDRQAAVGVGVITVPDIRWRRVDIKAVALLPNVLAKQRAVEAGAAEAWFVDEQGYVTEGASTNAWIVTGEGVLVTHPADAHILRGITRGVVFDLAERDGLMVEERRFSVSEVQSAREAFLTSTTQLLMPVVRIDGVAIGSGGPGDLTLRLRAAFHEAVETGTHGGVAASGRRMPKF